MGFYDINYDTLRIQLLPVRLRKSLMKAWLRCLIMPVRWLHNLFLENRKSNLYFLSHNSQVVYLEAVLNDTFDPVSRGISIEDGLFKDPLFAYLLTETNPLWLGLETETGSLPFTVPQVLYTDAETSLLGNSFIVRVPLLLSADISRIRALINQYRLAGRCIYAIVTY